MEDKQHERSNKRFGVRKRRRNSAVLPVGICLHKSEQEITDKTFETIEAAKNMIDVEAVKAAMNLATKTENRFNNAD